MQLVPYVHMNFRDVHEHNLNGDRCSDDDNESCTTASLHLSTVL